MKRGCYRREAEPLTERHVQAIWYDAAMRPPLLYTRRGEELRVVHPGDWNLEAGPDFRNAVLELGRERRRVRGDVEIHLFPSDWDAHGHGADPNYRNVVCHVTWGCGPVPASLPDGAVSVWLGRFLTAETGFSPERIDLEAYPYARLPIGERPCEDELRRDPELAKSVLFAAGEFRVRAKGRRLGTLMGLRERQQLFFEEVMNALGYSRNAQAFREVARRVPYEYVLSEPGNAAEAFLAAADFTELDRAMLRPCNSPENRLRAAAAIFTETRIAELADANDFSARGCRDIIDLICEGGYVGRGRAAAILANVVLPWAIARGNVAVAPEWLPPEDISSPVRLTAFRMFGRDHSPSAWYAGNGVSIQGLIQIHRDYCLPVHPDCAGCALVTDIRSAKTA